jgi:hypothetical protein
MTHPSRRLSFLALAAAGLLSLTVSPWGLTQAKGQSAQSPTNLVQFPMARSAAIVKAGCLPNARGQVFVTPGTLNDKLAVQVFNLAPNADYDLFVTQLPDAPFGVAWYQSDLHTNASGVGDVTVQGIFDAETFSISQGGVAGGNQTGATTAVTSTNVIFQPTSQFHLGLWFNSPDDAARVGCPNTVTPFNGEQHAGIQVLSTRNFPAGQGPLASIHR